MTDTDERVTRLLGELATRADGHAAPDRVGRVRSRARRAAAVRAGVVVGGLAAAVALVGGVRGVTVLRSDGPEPARPGPVVVVASPGLTINLKQDVALRRSIPDRGEGDAVAVVVVHVHGRVPARQVKEVSPSGREHLEGPRILYGGVIEGQPMDGAAPCAPAGPLVRVNEEFLHTVRVAKAGAYTVTVEWDACPPVGTVRQTITVQAD